MSVTFTERSAKKIARIVRQVERTPIDLRGTRAHRRYYSVFSWHLIQFGWSYSDTEGNISIKAGSVIKRDYTQVVIPEGDAVIGTSPTYVGIQIYRDLTNGIHLADTTEPVTDSTWVKFWFYIFQKDAVTGAIDLIGINLGQIMNVDITAYGD